MSKTCVCSPLVMTTTAGTSIGTSNSISLVRSVTNSIVVPGVTYVVIDRLLRKRQRAARAPLAQTQITDNLLTKGTPHMAGLAQSMSGGGMGGLIPMAFKRREDGDSRPPPIATGAIQPALPKKPRAPTIAGGGETQSY